MSPRPLTEQLTPATVERLRRLELFSRLRVEGYLKGENRSVRQGQSPEFLGHRPYFAGDDLRRIDWRIFGRSDRLTVKRYEEPANLQAAVAVDFSRSMAFGEGEQTKIECAIRAAALIFYLAWLQHDAFSLLVLGDRLRTSIPPGASRRRLMQVYAALVSEPVEGTTDFERALREAAPVAGRRALFILFSDCMDDPETIARALARLRTKGTDVIVFQVVHPAETDLPYQHVSRFTCLETGAATTVDPLDIRAAYRREFERHTLALRAALFRRGMDHCLLTVGRDVETPLGDYLQRRMELLS